MFLQSLFHTLETKYTLDDFWGKLIDDLFYINYLSYEYQNSEIKKITLDVTSRCNLNCKHCSGAFSLKNKGCLSKEIILEIFRWAEYSKINYVCLSGGEPFIRSDILEILSEANKIYSGTIEVITNGTLIHFEYLDEIIDAVDVINISLDGYDELSVSSIRGRGVYKKVIELIRELKKRNFLNIKLSIVKAFGNEKNIDRFLTLCNSLGVIPVVRDLIYSGNAKNIGLNTIKEYISNFKIDKTTLNMKCICNSGIDSLYISFDGKIYSCSTMYNLGLPITNLFNLLGSDFKIRFSPIPIVDCIKKCSNCDVRYFCANSCPSVNNSLYVNKDIVDYICNKNKVNIRKIIWGNNI